MKSLFVLCASLGVSSVASVALADETPPAIQLTPQVPASRPAPRIDLSTAPLAAPVQRTMHYHEGFYLRTSLGFGNYTASYTDNKRKNLNFDEDGGSMSIDLLIGGSPGPGVSIGGGLLIEPLLGSNGGFSTLVGPFIDGFPSASRGWHLGGLIGIAGQSFQNVNANDKQTAAGTGGAAWFGYDFWVANEWAIGPQLRLMGMRTGDTKSGEDVSSFARSITFGLSAVFN